jgi:cytochrome c oxidase subunit 2
VRAAPALLAALALAVACGPPEDPQVARGRALSRELGCIACHAVDATSAAGKLGPTWVGLSGSSVPLADGRNVVADEAYLRMSITEPDAATVAGYERGVMTAGLGAARARLVDRVAVDALIAYIRSLR